MVLIVFTILNTYYMIQIKDLKQKTIDLFYAIPQRICWKYYSHCEKFLKYFSVESSNDEGGKKKAEAEALTYNTGTVNTMNSTESNYTNFKSKHCFVKSYKKKYRIDNIA